MHWNTGAGRCRFKKAQNTVDDSKRDKGQKNVTLKTLKQKVSYGIGLSIGRNLKRDGLDVAPQLLVQGISDSLAGKEPLLTDDDFQDAWNAYQEELTETKEKQGQVFLAANGKKKGVVTTKSGLQYKIIKPGTGKMPKPTDSVSTHYHGTLLDGTVFDSSVDRKQPATFGVNQVISGWTEALQLMKVGAKWRLFIPSDLAYGARGSGNKIGPHTVLIFEIELLAIE